MIPIAQTIEPNIREELLSLMSQNKFLDKENSTVIGLFDKLKKLEQADKNTAKILRAYLLHLCGDFNSAVDELSDSNNNDYKGHEIAIRCNLGYCNSAHPLFQNFSDPLKGKFSQSYHLGIACGAIRTVAEFYRSASKMNLSNIKDGDFQVILKTEKMLEEFGIQDKDIGELMESAGSVLRENKIFFVGDNPVFEVIDKPNVLRTILLTYRLPVKPSEAVDLYYKFLQQLDDNSLNMPSGLHINFVGTQLA